MGYKSICLENHILKTGPRFTSKCSLNFFQPFLSRDALLANVTWADFCQIRSNYAFAHRSTIHWILDNIYEERFRCFFVPMNGYGCCMLREFFTLFCFVQVAPNKSINQVYLVFIQMNFFHCCSVVITSVVPSIHVDEWTNIWKKYLTYAMYTAADFSVMVIVGNRTL